MPKNTETALVQRILRNFNKGPVRLFRRNAGMGWAGRVERVPETKTMVIRPQDVVIRNARPLHAGDTGTPDMDGWVSIEVTPEMFGKRIAVACYLEAKSATGAAKKEQLAFLRVATEHGCRAGIVRSEDDVRRVLTLTDDGC